MSHGFIITTYPPPLQEKTAKNEWPFNFPTDIRECKDFTESMRRAEAAMGKVKEGWEGDEAVVLPQVEELVAELGYHVKIVMGGMMSRHKVVVPRAIGLHRLATTKSSLINTTISVLTAHEAAMMAVNRAYRGPGQGQLAPELLRVMDDAIGRFETAVVTEETRREERRREEEEKERRRKEK